MLEGIKVLDFTMLLPGPYASLRLADLGAEVIKVEPPGGDPARHVQSAAVFNANNRNKSSITIDLKTLEGKAQALTLLKGTDVVLEGFRPGVADRLGIGFEAAQAVNPQIIYCSLTGYGQTGPMRDLAGHDINYMAMSGLLAQLSGQENRPVVPKIQMADLVGGIVASEAVLAALVARSKSGQGQHLDVAMADAMMGLLTTHVLIEDAEGYPYGVEQLGGSVVCYNLYQTADRRYVSLGALEPKFWKTFCKAVEHPEWSSQQFSAAREENPVFKAISRLFLQHNLEFWATLGRDVDCCLQPVLNVGEVAGSVYAQERNMVFDLPTREGRRLRLVSTHAGGRTASGTGQRFLEPPELSHGPLQ